MKQGVNKTNSTKKRDIDIYNKMKAEKRDVDSMSIEERAIVYNYLTSLARPEKAEMFAIPEHSNYQTTPSSPVFSQPVPVQTVPSPAIPVQTAPSPHVPFQTVLPSTISPQLAPFQIVLSSPISPPTVLETIPFTVADGKRCICNKKLLLSYPISLPDQEYINFISVVSRKIHAVIEIAHDRVSGHTHVLLVWDSLFRSNKQGVFDYNGCVPQIRSIKDGDQLYKIRLYMANLRT